MDPCNNLPHSATPFASVRVPHHSKAEAEMPTPLWKKVLFILRHFTSVKPLLILWTIANCLIFFLSFHEYMTAPKHYYLYKVLGMGLCFSRGSAKVLNVQFIVIFISVCRTFRFFFLQGLRKWRKRLTSDFKTNDVTSASNSLGQGHLRDDAFYKSHHSPPSDKLTRGPSSSSSSSCSSSSFTFMPSSPSTHESTCKIIVDAPYGSLDTLDVTQLHQLSNVIEIQNHPGDAINHRNSNSDYNFNNNNNNEDIENDESSSNDNNNNSNNSPNRPVERTVSQTKCGPLRCFKLAFSFCVSWLLDHIFIPALDQVSKLHIYAGFTIAIASAVHTVAHVYNATKLRGSQNFTAPPAIGAHNTEEFLVFSMTGATGLLMVVVLLVMIAFACDWAKSRFYDAFWLSHRLFIVFVILMFLHPISNMLKEQTNTHLHNPKLCDSLPIIPSNAANCSCINITACADVTCIKPQTPDTIVTNDTRNNSSLSAVKMERNLLAINNGTINAQNVLPTALFTRGNNISAISNVSTIDVTEQPTIKQDGNSTHGPQGPKCPEAEFKPANHKTWIWLMSAIIVYILDVALCHCLSRNAYSDCILQFEEKEKSMQAVATYHADCNAIQLTMSDVKSSSPCKMVTPGSYVYIKCPSISQWQWHPFSVAPASSQGTNSFSVWISVIGDWSGKLKECIRQQEVKLRVKHRMENEVAAPESADETNKASPVSVPLQIQLSGPFASPYERILSYRTSIFIATGIGITPVLSFLSWMLQRISQSHSHRSQSEKVIRKRDKFKLRQLHLIWIGRNILSFHKLISFLSQVQCQLEERKRTACTTPAGDAGSGGGCSITSLQLKIHLFVTRQADQLKQSDALHLTNSDTCTHKITEGNDHQLSPRLRCTEENPNAPIGSGNDHQLHGHTDDLLHNNKQCTLHDQRNSSPSPLHRASLCPGGTKGCNQEHPEHPVAAGEQLNNWHPPRLECTFGRPDFVSIFKSNTTRTSDPSSSSSPLFPSCPPSSSSSSSATSAAPSSSSSTSSVAQSSSCCPLDTANASMNKCHMHTVGVFVCGNSSVRKSVKRAIFRVNLERGQKQFLYHSESFC